MYNKHSLIYRQNLVLLCSREDCFYIYISMSYCVSSFAACFLKLSIVFVRFTQADTCSHSIHFHCYSQLAQSHTVSGFELGCVAFKVKAFSHYAMLTLDCKKVSSGYFYKRYFSFLRKIVVQAQLSPVVSLMTYSFGLALKTVIWIHKLELLENLPQPVILYFDRGCGFFLVGTHKCSAIAGLYSPIPQHNFVTQAIIITIIGTLILAWVIFL